MLRLWVQFVVKRNGKKEPVHFDKITARISKLCYGLDPDKVQPVLVAQKVCAGVYPDVTTCELDDLAAETAAYMSTGACPTARRASSWLAQGSLLPTQLSNPRDQPLNCYFKVADSTLCRTQTTRSTRCWQRASPCPTCTRRPRRASWK